MALSDAIDTTKPVQGSPTTQSVRDNFSAAKSAIAQLELTAGVGPKGDQGIQGNTGTAATVSVGTTTTGAAGTNATVTNSGTAAAAVLNFTIPQGQSGTGGSGITEAQAIEAVEQGQPVFEEATVTTAPNWPTTPNLAGDPILGANWTLATGTGATGGYDHAIGSVEPLAYPVTVTSGTFYQVIFTNSRSSGTDGTMVSDPWGQFARHTIYFRNGPTSTTSQQTIKSNCLAGTTVVVKATINFTHLVVVPMGGWAGRFTLTRVVAGGAQNSVTMTIKGKTVMARGNSLNIGTSTGLLQTSDNNFSVGQSALLHNVNGSGNVAFGSSTLASNVGGSTNIAMGVGVMGQNTGGGTNIAIGNQVLNANTTGGINICMGSNVAPYTQTGSNNIMLGNNVGYALGMGSYNIAIGDQCLGYAGPPITNDTSHNICIGRETLQFVFGDHNLALGNGALRYLNYGTGTPGFATGTKENTSNNVGIGRNAGQFLANGTTQFRRPGDSVFLGSNTRGSATDDQRNQIVIGYGAVGHGSNTITLGNDEIDHLYTNAPSLEALSDERVKEEITGADLDKCVEAVKGLPLHRWKWGELAGKHFDHHVTGFMSDEIERVFPKAVIRADEWRTQRDAEGNAKKKLISELVTVGEEQEDGSWKQTAHSETREIEDRVLVKDCARVSLTEMLPTLWGAVQQLIQKVEALESQQAAPQTAAAAPAQPAPRGRAR